MASEGNFSDIPGCDFTARKYILKARRSQWTSLRQRPIVYSAATNLASVTGQIAVRRLNRQVDGHELLSQDICLVDKLDIEPDTSKVYGKLRVSQELVTQHAHGVVSVDGISSDGCQFLRGDRLWLMVDPSTDTQLSEIPVVNLRSFQAGKVQLERVFWYPVAQLESGSLLTFGGVSKNLRLGNTWHCKNWAIMQSPDTTAVHCGTVDLNEGITRLTSAEREEHFADRVQLLDPMANRDYEASSSLSPISLPSLPGCEDMQALWDETVWAEQSNGDWPSSMSASPTGGNPPWESEDLQIAGDGAFWSEQSDGQVWPSFMASPTVEDPPCETSSELQNTLRGTSPFLGNQGDLAEYEDTQTFWPGQSNGHDWRSLVYST